MNHSRIFRLVLLGCGLLAARADGDEPPTADDLRRRASAVLAQLDGTLKLPRLEQPVEILRDRWGVPHIYARSQHDLFYAQGVVVAQDRLFQIDLWRRTARGETAEVLGPAAIERDRLARLVRYRGDWEAEWASYGPDARAIATAFTDGINDYINHLVPTGLTNTSRLALVRLPIEFQLAGYRPGRWVPEDVPGRMAGIVMVRNVASELARAELTAAVGLEQANRLLPTRPAVDVEVPAGLDLTGLDRSVGALLKRGTEKTPFAPRPATGDGDAGDVADVPNTAAADLSADQGSNNWTIHGSRTASGAPILANDPHRPINLPSLRYLVHLHAPGWNLIGAGEPALPGIALGHNEQIAWGLTIVGNDQADLVVEELDPHDPTRYRGPDGWLSIETERTAIRVAGRPEPVTVELRYTRHGPIVHEDAVRRRVVALRWVGAEPGTAGYLGGLALGRATNWDEFRRAARSWRLPSENLVYADKAGNIGWIAVAQTPVRRAGRGLLPVPGGDDRYRWDSFLSYDDLPQEFNPPRGYIGTANADIRPSGYTRDLAFEWSPPYRQDRVRAVLAEQPRHTPADSQRLQHDNVSLPGRALVKLAACLPSDDGELAPYVRSFREWDGKLDVDSRVGPLYAHWLAALLEAVYARQVPKPQLDIVRASSGVEPMLAALENPTVAWFGDDPTTVRDAILTETFGAAVAKTRKEQGDDPAAWSWGRAHTAKFDHPLAGLGGEYAKAFNLGPVPRSGDGFTPNATSHNERFEQSAGASYRQIFDLADWDRGLATSVPGQSGQLGSPHYADLLPLWTRGEYFPLKYSRAAVEEVTLHRLTLTPQPSP